MATIRTAISLYDGVSGPAARMQTSLNNCTRSFEAVERASASTFDPSNINSTASAVDEMNSNVDQVESNIRQADSAQDQLNNSMRQGASNAGGLLDKVKTLAGAYLGLQGVKKVLELSDEMTSTNARLNLIVDDGGSVAALEDQIKASALRSRAAYTDTAAAVSKLGLMAGDAFDNTDEIIAFTELVNKQFTIAGASATESKNAMLQLTQAMASGVLRGDELNSIFEQAPNLIQAIADYLGKPIGQIREMASEGEITADIVKNAMFAASDDINGKFESMPMTWAQVGTQFANIMLQTFEPLLQAVGAGAQFITDHWSTLEPIFWGLAAAVGAYAIALGIQTVATWVATGAAQTFFATLLANPLFWIALAVGVVVAAIYKWVQSVGGLQVAWAICCNALMTAWDWVKIGFMTGVYFVINLWDKMKLGMMEAGTAIANYMGQMKADVLTILQNMVNGAIGIINDFIALLNKLPGVSIDAIATVTFGTTAQLENAAATAARNADLQTYRSGIEAGIADRDASLNSMITSARAATADREANIASLQAANTAQDSTDLFDYGSAIDQIGDNAADTAANTAATADALDYAEEDLQYLRDIAEREAINRFTTAEVKVDMTGMTNKIDSEMDIDGIFNQFGEKFAEVLDVSEEGVHE